MPDPADLLAVARLLVSVGSIQPPSDAQLRRAVSTAYYALFHKILRAAADRFMGAGKQRSAGYGLLYRSFNHGRMKAVCASLGVAPLSKNLQQQLGRTAVSQDMRDVAAAFVDLQEARHRADYDPSASFLLSDVVGLVDFAENAMITFDRIAADEQADILALMLASPKG